MGGDKPPAVGASLIERQTLTRRSALAAAGAAVAGSVVPTVSAVPDANATVENAGGGFVATNGGSTVYQSGDLIDAMQAAVDSIRNVATGQALTVADWSLDNGADVVQ